MKITQPQFYQLVIENVEEFDFVVCGVEGFPEPRQDSWIDEIPQDHMPIAEKLGNDIERSGVGKGGLAHWCSLLSQLSARKGVGMNVYQPLRAFDTAGAITGELVDVFLPCEITTTVDLVAHIRSSPAKIKMLDHRRMNRNCRYHQFAQ